MSDYEYQMLETTIRIPGLPRKLTIMHITDSHLTEADERDDDRTRELAEARAEVFRGPEGSPDTMTKLRHQVSMCNDLRVDLAVFTGDIIDFPSQANLDALHHIYGELHCPYLYTLGNHDWSFPFVGYTEEHRLPAYSKFARWASQAPGCEAVELDGVTVIAADNSNNRLTEAQAGKIRSYVDSGPGLLFMHIPIAVPSLIPDVVSVWKAPIVMGTAPEVLARFDALQLHLAPDDSTASFCEWADKSRNLFGVFCGHVHFAHTDALSTGHCQYVTAPGYKGGSRRITLLPG